MERIGLRPPSDYENEIFTRLLSVDFPGRELVKKQLADCLVREIDKEGSVKIKTNILEKATVPARVPVEAMSSDSDGIPIHFLLHVINGFVDELEIYKDAPGAILKLPAANKLELMVITK